MDSPHSHCSTHLWAANVGQTVNTTFQPQKLEASYTKHTSRGLASLTPVCTLSTTLQESLSLSLPILLTYHLKETSGGLSNSTDTRLLLALSC